MTSTSRKRSPSIVNLTVKRRYLTQREVERLMDCARKHGRYGHRDATMILVAYRHGLRASEVCDLQWQQIELSQGRLHVHRVKNGIPSVHPIRGDEMRALRKLRRDYPRDAHVFISERGGPMSPIGFHRLIQRLGEAAKMPFPIHPHMLRHACGFKLANDGHDTRALQHYLGHKNIQHTVRYTEMAPTASRIFGANWRRQARDRLALDYLGIRGRIALRNQRLNHLDRALDLLIGHRLNAAGMLHFQLFRDEHGADLQVARRALPPHPLEHLAPMLLPILRQIEQKALVERSARSLW
jgi:hypothetical protein